MSCNPEDTRVNPTHPGLQGRRGSAKGPAEEVEEWRAREGRGKEGEGTGGGIRGERVGGGGGRGE